jgi:ribosomal protein S12 methylthiotransferase accessory factor
VLYREEQYADLPYAPYREDSTLAWIRGRSLLSDDEVWIPAIGVFMEYQVHHPEEFSSGNVKRSPPAGADSRRAGGDLRRAGADALLIAWLNRLPGRRLDAAGHPDAEVRELALSYRRRGVELALYALPTDHPVAVVLGIAFQRGGYDGPFATVGLGADLDLAAAARGAALEVGQVRPAFRERCRTRDAGRIAELVADPSRTKTLEDHALLYADPQMAPVFAFLEGEHAGEWPESRSRAPKEALVRVLDHFVVEQEVLYVNLTPPDLEPLGLHTARAILPGFQPIWFGRGERRLGGSRLFELPRRLRAPRRAVHPRFAQSPSSSDRLRHSHVPQRPSHRLGLPPPHLALPVQHARPERADPRNAAVQGRSGGGDR